VVADGKLGERAVGAWIRRKPVDEIDRIRPDADD
jgi:hypothetical protein